MFSIDKNNRMNKNEIILEQKHEYSTKVLFVIMLPYENSYRIDVTNTTSGFGKILLDNRDQAEYVFTVLNESLNEFDDYVKSCEFAASILENTTFIEIVLALHTNRRLIDKLEMYALIQMLELDKTERYTIMGGHIITVNLKGSEKEYGEFILLGDAKKYMFHYF